MGRKFVDIFAGPGGLGEGFASYSTADEVFPFNCALSIEKEPRAHQTLSLRSFLRNIRLQEGSFPIEYYRFLQGCLSLDELLAAYPKAHRLATAEARCIELGGAKPGESPRDIDRLIAGAVKDDGNWILLGGPPCQAYSLVGRSRMGGIREDDPRVRLYMHYLRILAVNKPAAFVFENVRGLSSSSVKGEAVLNEILDGLHSPLRYLRSKDAGLPTRTSKTEYQLFSLNPDSAKSLFGDIDFTVHMDRFGIPQMRKRLIILGIRSDIAVPEGTQVSLTPSEPPTLASILKGMPRLRSGLSKGDSPEAWVSTVQSIGDNKRLLRSLPPAVSAELISAIAKLRLPKADRGTPFVSTNGSKAPTSALMQWILDPRIGGVVNHESRGHIPSDLHRYIFASCFGKATGRSPLLQDFPDVLLPDHKNAERAQTESLFNDRFRVQLANHPATTVTSHISKDGHYFIHPDPTQCRSLTVREAARIQTFPDNYFFRGPRTAQYTQVGNAVPPYLARQIAEIVDGILGC